MKIKRLEAIGFKSFAEKTSFHFPPGVTAIVGPNGCGKSNIVDAIKWVLGEQGAKPLRGKSMEDVIFNGSERRKPVGMAEVCLTLSNEDGLAPQGYADFSEIEIKRRLYRSGESEYYINNTPCRLKDITELFMDTGIGHRSYSIVEQGHIEWLINSKPEERRSLIEEAAGIHKYKTRKEEALKKLKATEQNCLRVRDIIYEVDRQIKAINREAKKAEAFKSLRDEVKAVELALIGDELRKLKKEKDRLEGELKSFKETEVGFAASLSSREGEEEEKRLLLMNKEAEIQRFQSKLLEKEEEIRKIEKEIEINELKFQNLRLNIDETKGAIDELVSKRKVVIERNNLLKEEKGLLLSKIGDMEKEIKEGEDSLNSLKESIAPVYGVIEGRKKAVVGQLTSLARVKNSLSNCEDDKGRVLKMLEKIKSERNDLNARLKTIDLKIKDLTSSLEERMERVDQLVREVEVVLKEAGSLKVEREARGKELDALKEGLAEVSIRLSTLKESRELQKGIMNTLVGQGKDRKKLEGIHGQVADIFNTEPEFERALEAVLGERLQGIVVESCEDGVRAIEYLKKEGSGRGSFIPMRLRGRRKSEIENQRSKIRNPQSAMPVFLLDKVRVKDGYSSIAEYLLGDILLSENLDDAVNLWISDGIDKTLVTLDGDVIDFSGMITGGNINGLDRGVFKKKREIEKLSWEAASLGKREEGLIKDIDGIARRFTLLTEKAESMKGEIHRGEIDIISLKGECNTLSEERTSLKRRIEVLSLEEEQLKDDLKIAEESYAALLKEKELLKAEIKREEGFIEEEERRLKGFLLEKEGIERGLTEKRINHASIKSRLEALELRFKANQADLHDIDVKISSGREKIERDEKECERLTSSIESGQKRLIEGMGVLEELRREKGGLEVEYALYAEGLKAIEEGIREERKNINALQENISKRVFELKELDLNINHLLERAEERYGVKEGELIKCTREDYERKEFNKRLALLKERLISMGDVNLSAIEELKGLEERHTFLTDQYDDLNKSIASLQRVIHRINRVSRLKFAKTFSEINKRFQELYVRFFGGGVAELKLLEKENPLETGVDIIAQPLGKRLQGITLLSGGEKALTVLALIFALFLVRPSPFFILDEADAPLDEPNTIRFINLIKELSQRSQFVLITHNKETMEMADTLYGITMAEPGVSKILSVRLKEI